MDFSGRKGFKANYNCTRNVNLSLAGLGIAVFFQKGVSRVIEEGRKRVVIENVKPEIDSGAFPAKRVVGEKVEVSADIFSDGHDSLSARLLYRRAVDSAWTRFRWFPG